MRNTLISFQVRVQYLQDKNNRVNPLRQHLLILPQDRKPRELLNDLSPTQVQENDGIHLFRTIQGGVSRVLRLRGQECRW